MRWHTSSYSGGGEGNDCVEVAVLCSHVSIRDSIAPTRATVTVQAGTFATSIRALKARFPRDWRARRVGARVACLLRGVGPAAAGRGPAVTSEHGVDAGAVAAVLGQPPNPSGGASVRRVAYTA
ncbi:DUF397 domain-containing protein [Streptomyces sp. NPDC017405]|uniref:DUF397 domain-containing protein n=1 Tax=unclassified Streptomyces TaxID=2593676 RepID=UPI0037AFCB2D